MSEVLENVEGELHSLASLLKVVDDIEIPIIQRDYAQGRSQAIDVRAKFLEDLHDALAPMADRHPLNLDFIYGSINEVGSPVLSLLDGQQRLTTLFLLHWFLAVQDGQGQAFRASFMRGKRSRFRYATRASAGEFFDALAYSEVTIGAHKKLSLALIDASWFFLAWRTDPTVQSCLEMLDGIDDVFRGELGLYLRLTDLAQPRVTFHFLRLPGFGLSDDLYIKMNARGKPLTAFENFKAWLVSRPERPDRFDQQMDQDWANFFWQLTKEDANAASLCDEFFLRLLYLMALFEACERFVGNFWAPANQARAQWVGALRTARGYLSLKQFDAHNAFSAEGISSLWEVLEYFCKSPLPQEVELVHRCMSGKETHYDVVRLYALVRFVVVTKADTAARHAASSHRSRWVRVTSNLVNNARIDELGAVPPAIRGLRALSTDALILYEKLSLPGAELVGPYQEQFAEEAAKASLIVADPSWETPLVKAEQHPYLQGRVGFLLHMSCSEEGEPLKAPFEVYAAKAAAVLQQDILRSNEYLLQRALLALGDYSVARGGGRYSFCAPDATAFRDRHENWLQVLSRPIFKQLLDRMGDDITQSLRNVIHEGIANCSNWRKYLVEKPELIHYCRSHLFDRTQDSEGNTRVYLMSKTRLSGYYSELRSRALYLNLIDLRTRNQLPKGLKTFGYEEVYDGSEPALLVHIDKKLKITFADGVWKCHDDGAQVCPMPESIQEAIRLGGLTL